MSRAVGALLLPDNRLRPGWREALLQVAPGWRPLVETWLGRPATQALLAHLDQRLADGAVVYPAQPLRALALTPRDAVRVVVLGQDPYHGPGQAEGLAFSVPPGVRPPPSLRNILQEWQRDLGLPAPTSGHLGAWARRGVLLLNVTCTVEDGEPASHAGRGWESLTDAVVGALIAASPPTVFMLWGAHAQRLAPVVEAAAAGHLVLASNHPSPLSARRPPVPFVGCGHFGRAAAFLAAAGRPIDWRLDR